MTTHEAPHDADRAMRPVLIVDGYPTAEALDFLRTFAGSPRELVEHLTAAMRAYGCVRVEKTVEEFANRPIREVYMATGGWSGNESIIGHLERSFFWFAYWESSRRGGAYTFHVPEDRWEQPMIDWPPAHLSTPDGQVTP